MARTKDEIFNDLMDRKDASPVLSNIMSSNSKASFYQSLFYLYAGVTGDFELTFDDFTAQVDALLESKQVHTSSWWRRISLEYQIGDPLIVFENGNLGYGIVDESKQIIKRAAIITTEAGAIRLKVAKLDVSENPIPLSGSENSAFDSYINDVAPAGIAASIVSVNGDEIQLSLSVTVDSQIINSENGELLADSSVKPVEDTIIAYFASFQNDDFGGTFYANKLLQSILSTNGVINSTLTTLEQKADGQGSFTDVLDVPGKQFVTFAGYVKLANGFDLSANITYISD